MSLPAVRDRGTVRSAVTDRLSVCNPNVTRQSPHFNYKILGSIYDENIDREMFF